LQLICPIRQLVIVDCLVMFAIADEENIVKKQISEFGFIPNKPFTVVQYFGLLRTSNGVQCY
jgi:hypothetical protein